MKFLESSLETMGRIFQKNSSCRRHHRI